MAETNSASLLALLNQDDLTAFSQSVTASDPYAIAQSALGAYKPDTSMMGMGGKFANSFGAAFLSGYLGNKARENVRSQLSAVTSALPSLYSNPLGTATPEGVDEQAFAQIRANMTLKSLLNAEKKKEKMEDFNIDLVKGSLLEKFKTIAGIQGKQEAYGLTGTEDPDSPAYKLKQDKLKPVLDLEQETRATLGKGPVAQNYQIRLSSLQNILSNVNNDTVYGDLALVNGFQKIQDPEGSVREGDVTTIQAAQDRLSKYVGDTKGWFSSDGRLKPEYRKQLAKTAANTVNSYGKVYQNLADQNLAVVKAAGGDPANIPYIPHTDFKIDDYFKGGVADPLSAIDAALAKKGFNPDGTSMTSSQPKVSNSLFGLD